MKPQRSSILTAALLLTASALSADTIPGGDVSGTWYQSHSPYYIAGDITIQGGNTLTIEPGVDVVFLGRYRVTVGGQLIADGTASDSIRFVPQDTIVGWRGLYYARAPRPALSYCHIEHARESGIWLRYAGVTLRVSHCTITRCRSDYGGGIRVHNMYDTLFISHSTIAYNTAETDSGGKGGGIYLDMGFLQMDSCTVHANRAVIPREDYFHAVQGGGIYFGTYSSCGTVFASSITDNFIGLSNGGRSQAYDPPDRGGGIFNKAGGVPIVISHCVISGNRANVDYRSGAGIGCERYSSTTLSYCDISNNWTPVYAGGFETEGNAQIVNCTFSGNHYYAIICGLAGYSVNVLNTVVAYNTLGMHHYGTVCTLRVRCSDIIDTSFGMPPGFGVLDRVNRNRDSCDRYFNIFMNPMFVDTANHNYHLLASSPCIDAGDSTSPKDPDSTFTDMGCYYFHQIGIKDGHDDPRCSISDAQLKVSPNPTTAKQGVRLLAIGNWHGAELRIYDASGRVVRSFPITNNHLPITIRWDGRDDEGTALPPGVYFCRLKSAEHTETVKMVKLH